MPRLKKGSKEAKERAQKMRAGKEKNTEEETKQPGVVYCPSCLKKGEKIVMTKRGSNTLVCPKCQTWIKKEV